jgi:anti-sigma-K factor RskA
MLTLDLVDRLLASRLVPRDAKLAAVESWRRELAAMREKYQDCRRLEQRLAEASRLLAAPWPWAALGQYLSAALAHGRAKPAELAVRYPRQ